jgi:hypothetical protein
MVPANEEVMKDFREREEKIRESSRLAKAVA